MNKTFLIGLVFTLSACGGTTIQDRPVTVKVPVLTSCVTNRPDEVKSLNEEITLDKWQNMDVSQKAGAVSYKGLQRQTYGEQLYAATSACK